MTNEEAISLLEDQMNFNRTMQRGWGNTLIETDAGNIVDGALYANQHKDVADALDLAINALRAGGKDMNVPTMPAGQPLTLEQLRGMEGQKALIYRMKSTEPLEPGTVKDREVWTSEWINSMPALGAGDLETRCKSCGNLVLFETDFCPYCGKAMTEEGWAELEKRVMGVKNYGT